MSVLLRFINGVALGIFLYCGLLQRSLVYDCDFDMPIYYLQGRVTSNNTCPNICHTPKSNKL